MLYIYIHTYIHIFTQLPHVYGKISHQQRDALRAPLLVRDPEKKFYVNYDPEIEKILREAKYFDRIGTQFEASDIYKLPQGAKDLLRRKDSVKEARRVMESLLKTYEEQKARIPPIFQPLMEGHIREVHQKISKGLIYICWNSLIQDKFFQELFQHLLILELYDFWNHDS